MTFRRAAWRARTPKCHYYCSFVTDYEIVQIVLTCNSAAKVIIMKMARHAASKNVILTAVLIQTVQWGGAWYSRFILSSYFGSEWFDTAARPLVVSLLLQF